ncbi:MAG: D-3-phosphoglycerate dehydrogenase / 2-oxoglutarate reductase [Thermoproteota archaeon]|nr:D-3-phosphoglycerate dehydrogenase / 2-oxoglutarate reductase [Thermoproteota archaeon]
MVKILVVTDPTSQPLWEEDFKKCLGNLYASQQIRYINPRLDGPTAIRTQTQVVQGVREARGDPEQLKNEMGDTEVLVVEFAPVTEAVINSGKGLKLVASTRGGPVNVDVKAAAKKNILVTHTQGRLAQPVSDHAMGLILAEARNIARSYAAIRDGTFFSDPNIRAKWHRIPEMEGKTLGIVGFGNVGREVAKRAAGFGMNIIAYDPYVKEEDGKKLGVKMVSLEDLMKESDFVTVHAREAPETFHLINKDRINLMKPTAYVINTSRGSIIDEKALYEAAKDGKITGVALDVYEDEPLKASNPLIKLENVTLTPHTAGGSDRARERSILLTTIIVSKYVRGEKLTPMDIIDPEKALTD